MAAQRYGSEYLELTLSEIAVLAPGVKGDQQVGAALKIMEQHGYVQRGRRQENRGELRLVVPRQELLARFPEPKTQRAILVHAALAEYDDDLAAGVQCNYHDLSAISGLSAAQLQRVLRALADDGLQWQAPFAGRGMTLLRPEEATLEIDFTEQQAHLDLEKARLDDMLSYPNSPGCRQSFLVQYFGQATDSWTCQACDRCRGDAHHVVRAPTAGEADTIKQILRGARELRGRFGKNRLAQHLGGSRNRDIMEQGLHHRPFYGALAEREQTYLLRLIDSLIDAGLLEVAGERRYPLVRITAAGRNVLSDKAAPQLHFEEREPPPRSATPRPRRSRPTPDQDDPLPAGLDDLYERLRALRKKIADKRRCPAYQVFSNATLRGLAEETPVSAAEARGIKGVGPAKERSVLPEFLAEIQQWRRENTAG